MNKLRRDGAGSVQEVGPGRYRVRLSLPDGTRKSFTVNATDRDDANRLADAMTYQVRQKRELGVPTLRVLGKTFFDEREVQRRVSKNALENDKRNWKNHVLDAHLDWCDAPITEITRASVTLWLSWLETKHTRQAAAWSSEEKFTEKFLSRQTRVHCRNVLKLFFDWCIEKAFCTVNPVTAIEVRSTRSDADADDAWTFLTAEEIALIANCEAIPNTERDLFLFAIYSGMRQGELWALKWKNVSLDGMPRVEVRRSHDRSTKSKKVRHFPLLPLALEALQRQYRRVKHEPDCLVWPDANGNQRPEKHDAGWGDRVREKNSVRPGWKSVAGITRRVRFHDLRHTCASHLLMGTWGRTWSLDEVRAFIGHSSNATTARYAHLSADHLHKAASMTVGQIASNEWQKRWTQSQAENAIGEEKTWSGLPESNRRQPAWEAWDVLNNLAHFAQSLSNSRPAQTIAEEYLVAVGQRSDTANELLDELIRAGIFHAFTRDTLLITIGEACARTPFRHQKGVTLAGLMLSAPLSAVHSPTNPANKNNA